MKRFTSLGLVIAAACDLGCSAQVGEEYRGEVMLRLSGSVKTENEAQDSLEPALVFFWGEGLQSTQYFVRGKVEGVFPSKFVISVTDPPPAAVMPNGVAIGTFALVDADTPAIVKNPDSRTSGDCGVGRNQQSCEETQQYCTGERCYERDLKCEFTACELLHSEGDPELVEAYVAVYASGETETFKGDAAEVDPGSASASGSSSSTQGSREPVEPNTDADTPQPESTYYVNSHDVEECSAGTCLYSGIHCTIADECYSELRRCEESNTKLQYNYSGRQAFCEVTQERGDRSVMVGLQATPTARNYSVVYLTQEGLELVGDFLGDVEVGYNVFEADLPTDEQLVERGLCFQGAARLAIAELNRRHNMNESLGSWSLSSEQRDELSALEVEYRSECEELPEPRRVENPSDTTLRVEIGTPVAAP